MRHVEDAFLEAIKDKYISAHFEGRLVALKYANITVAGSPVTYLFHAFSSTDDHAVAVGQRYYTFDELRELRILDHGEKLHEDGSMDIRFA